MDRRIGRSHSLSAVLLCLLLLARVLPAASVPRPPELDPAKIVTPHIAWAKPYDGKPVRALVLTRWGATREVYELAQRMDIEFTIYDQMRGHVASEDETNAFVSVGVNRLPALLGAPLDVIMIGGIQLRSLPLEVQYGILKKVTEGTGLVMVNVSDKAFASLGPVVKSVFEKKEGPLASILRGVPCHAFRTMEPTDTAKYTVYTMGGVAHGWKEAPLDFVAKSSLYAVGRGRCAVIVPTGDPGSYAPVAPGILPGAFTPPDRPMITEYFFSLVAKTVLWAAGRTPAAAVAAVIPDNATVSVGEPSPAAVTIEAERPFSGTIEAVLRNKWGERTAERTIPVRIMTSGRISVPVPLGVLDAGEYSLDVRLLRGRRVVDWGSSSFAAAGAVSIARAEVSKPFFEPDEPVTAAVSIANAPAGAVLRAALRDGERRIVERADFPISAGAAAVSLRLRRPSGIVYRLETAVVAGGRVLAAAEREVRVPIRARDDYYCSVNDGHEMNYIGYLRARRALEMGADCQRTYGVQRSEVIGSAHYGLTPAPFFTHTGGCGFLGVPTRCMSAPEYQKAFRDGLADVARTLQPYGASCYNLGDDTGICERLCEQPGCFDRFVEYLKRRYPNVAAANKVWRTAVKDWKDVTPAFLGDNQTKANYGPWIDYLYYHEDMYLDTFKAARAAVNAVDPHAWVGQDASGFANVVDLYVENQTYVSPYFRRVLAKKIGSFCRGKEGFYGSCVGTYTGMGRDPVTMAVPWDMLFAGQPSILFWSLTTGMAGDLTVHPQGYMMEAIEELKKGIGNVLAKAEIRYAPILLHHSRASKHASGIEYRLGTQDLAEEAFQFMIEDQGLQARWTATSRVERGEIARLAPKVVILPYAQALGAAETKALRDFVAAGGTLVADVRPAVYDDHCQPLSPGALDDVFGIRRSADPKAPAIGELVMKKDFGPLAAGTVLCATMADGSVRPSGATAYAGIGEAPAVLLNTFGKGRAVLLNFFVGKYESLLDKGQAGPLRALVGEVLAGAGCGYPFRAFRDGRPAAGCELVHFAIGPVDVLGVAPNALSCERYPARLDVRLPEERHVYDMRTGAYLGRTKTASGTCAALDRKVFALLPYRVTGLSLNVPRQAAAGQTVTVSGRLATTGPPGRHLIRVEAADPAGVSKIWFREKIWTENGSFRLDLPLAWNETGGVWTVTATDVLSGTSAARRVTVLPAGAREGRAL